MNDVEGALCARSGVMLVNCHGSVPSPLRNTSLGEILDEMARLPGHQITPAS